MNFHATAPLISFLGLMQLRIASLCPIFGITRSMNKDSINHGAFGEQASKVKINENENREPGSPFSARMTICLGFFRQLSHNPPCLLPDCTSTITSFLLCWANRQLQVIPKNLQRPTLRADILSEFTRRVKLDWIKM